jgi:hypothetical protein
MAYELKKRDLQSRAPLTYVTSEPFLAHFGMGGFGSGTKMTEMFFKHLNIEGVTNAKVREFTKDEVHLEGGQRIAFKYAMFAPRFLGVDPVRALTEIATQTGFVKVNAHYQTEVYPEVYAAGVAVQVDPPQKTPVPCGVPKTGYLSEEMARVVAHNIVATIAGEPLIALPPASIDAKCVLDAGNNGIIMTSDRFLEPLACRGRSIAPREERRQALARCASRSRRTWASCTWHTRFVDTWGAPSRRWTVSSMESFSRRRIHVRARWRGRFGRRSVHSRCVRRDAARDVQEGALHAGPSATVQVVATRRAT